MPWHAESSKSNMVADPGLNEELERPLGSLRMSGYPARRHRRGEADRLDDMGAPPDFVAEFPGAVGDEAAQIG